MDRLLIIDGHAYAYRAFYAIRGLRSPSGSPTNAIYGFVKMLAKMRALIGPTHLIALIGLRRCRNTRRSGRKCRMI